MDRRSEQSEHGPTANARSALGTVVRLGAFLVGLAASVGLIAIIVVAVLG
jgi:hypothetical protein